MCHPLALAAVAGTAVGTSFAIGNKLNQKENDKAKKAVDKVSQAAAKQQEANQIANSVQSTTPIEEQGLKQKLAAQKIPLNTTNTGVAVGNGLSTGLNLGGY